MQAGGGSTLNPQKLNLNSSAFLADLGINIFTSLLPPNRVVDWKERELFLNGLEKEVGRYFESCYAQQKHLLCHKLGFMRFKINAPLN